MMSKSINVKKQIESAKKEFNELSSTQKFDKLQEESKYCDGTMYQTSFKRDENGKIAISECGVMYTTFKTSFLEKKISKNFILEDFIAWHSIYISCIQSEFDKTNYEMPVFYDFDDIKKYFYEPNVHKFDFTRACVQERKDSCFLFLESKDSCFVMHSWRNFGICPGLNPKNVMKYGKSSFDKPC